VKLRDASERIAFGVAAAVIAFAVIVPMKRRHARATAAIPTAELHVPRATDTLERDGELDEPSWLASARSGHFLAPDGKEATPYSDARFVWTKDALRIGLYAADEDIVSADAFRVTLRAGGVDHVIEVGPRCLASNPRVKVACDADGTLDVAGDADEEWVVEMEVPLTELGLRGAPGERVDASVRRCDVRANVEQATERKRCGEMSPIALILDP
jgi:hypothetical protein